MNSMDNGTKDSVDGLFEYDIEYSCITDISFFLVFYAGYKWD